jgi:hypothetical protein
MNDRDVTALLERRAGAVSTSEPPIDAIVAAARAGRPDRRRRAAFLAAAAVLVLILGSGAAWIAERDHASSTGPVSPSRPTGLPTQPLLPPEHGFRWAGLGTIAFRVPSSWTTSDGGCSDATVGTVVVNPPRSDICAQVWPGKSSLHLADLDPRNFIAEMEPSGGEHHVSIDGVPALVTDPVDLSCGRDATSPCASLYGVSVEVPSRNVLAWAVSPSRSTAVDIAASARVIPDGYSAVPSLVGAPQSNAADALGQLGLAPETLCPGGGHVCDGGFTVAQTDPLGGSIVPDGSVVQMLAADPAADLATPPFASITPDRRLSVTTASSSVCPLRAQSVEVVGSQHVVVSLDDSGATPCTADVKVFRTQVALPAGVQPNASVIVELVRTDGTHLGSLLARVASTLVEG